MYQVRLSQSVRPPVVAMHSVHNSFKGGGTLVLFLSYHSLKAYSLSATVWPYVFIWILAENKEESHYSLWCSNQVTVEQRWAFELIIYILWAHRFPCELKTFFWHLLHFPNHAKLSNALEMNQDISTCSKLYLVGICFSTQEINLSILHVKHQILSWKSSYKCCTKNLHTNSLESRRGFIRTRLRCLMEKPADINYFKTSHVKHWFVVTLLNHTMWHNFFVAFSTL